jgi:hypothetical protein
MFLWLLNGMPARAEPLIYFGYFLPIIIIVGIGIPLLAFPKKPRGKE